MFPSARRRPGTSPSFWRAYHQAQLRVAASTTGLTATAAEKVPNAKEPIVEYKRTKRPAASHFVCVGR
jgi:hypothetical protein